MNTTYNLDTFIEDDMFYGELRLLLTIKSFDLKAIRKRWLNSHKNKSGKTGSVERRPISTGGIAAIKISGGRIAENQLLFKASEPRGIDSHNSRIAVSLANAVYIWDGTEHFQIKNDWFSYIHTVEFSPFNPSHILVSSSGLDTILEIDFKRNLVLREWCAWENGFNKASDPHSGEPVYLTRRMEDIKKYEREGKDYLLIKDPSKDFLPTALRAAFINSVSYDPANSEVVIATFFHEGKVYEINLSSGASNCLIDGLQNPHGGCKHNGGYFATSTSAGLVVFKSNTSFLRYNFQGLGGKPPELRSREWLQNSCFHRDNIITIDSNRNAFIIFNVSKQLKSVIPYDENWAIQDMVPIDADLDYTQLSQLTYPTD